MYNGNNKSVFPINKGIIAGDRRTSFERDLAFGDKSEGLMLIRKLADLRKDRRFKLHG